MATDGIEWICPYCSVASLLIPAESMRQGVVMCDLEGADGHMGIQAQFTMCRNPKCRRKTVQVSLRKAAPKLVAQKIGPPIPTFSFVRSVSPIAHRQLIPARGLKVFPEYVPAPIRQDYE